MTAPARSLDDWLERQQRTHPRAIDLGLERVREVWQRLGAAAPARVVITVGGTNGKGSTVAFLEAILAAADMRVGAFTSPHLLRYNERIRIAGVDASDAQLVDAFAHIERARGDISLTYFEFNALAALWLFARASLDAAVLEVGLGGRLDAVNIVDADAAIVTTIDFDHQEWLGDDRDSIGREKAGIFRGGRPAIVGEADPPRGLLDAAAATGARLQRAGHEFRFDDEGASGWRWFSGDTELHLPRPRLRGPRQLENAAAAIAALYALRDRLQWNPHAIERGILAARIGARLQRFGDAPELVVDVAHNPQAARVLAEWLVATPVPGRTLAVFGALGDKDVGGVVAAVIERVDAWFVGGLDADSPRGLAAAALSERVRAVSSAVPVHAHADIATALAAAFAAAAPGDRVIAFGSFFLAAAAIAFARARGLVAEA